MPEFKTARLKYHWGDGMDVKFTMVMDETLARKMSYIGKYYGRSRIKEIEWACKEYVQAFEANIDKIELEDT